MTRLFRLSLLLFSMVVLAQKPMFPQPLSPRIANYRIEVALDAETSRLKGTEMILWHNKTDSPTEDLRFHLYLNGFRNDQSSFMVESEGSHRDHEIDPNGYGFTELSTLRVSPAFKDEGLHSFSDASHHPDPASLTEKLPQLTFLAPDDGNTADKTYARVPLDAPLMPGESVWIYITWEAQLPEPPFARTGSIAEFFFIAQWFPKIAVLKPGGVWTDHQFHLNTEFFADYGVYDVFMTVPKDHVLGATGLQVSVTEIGEQKTHYYHAEDVHDFAWTCSPDFIEGKAQAQDVAIRVLAQREHAGQLQRMLDAAVFSVTYFQDWYGDYPFPNLTVVDPRRGGGGAGGMEYPTLITAGTDYGAPSGMRELEAVILHEFGHNYWYHLLGSNEWEESWLDEGINSYTESLILADKYPSGDILDLLGMKLQMSKMHRMGYSSNASVDPTVLPGWTYYSNGTYNTMSYSKPAVILLTLDNHVGRETMRKVMQTYVSRWSFKHPTSQDFINVVNEVTGQNFQGFFDQALYTRKTLDYAVSKVEAKKVLPVQGFEFNLDIKKPRTAAERKEGGQEEPEETDTYNNVVKIKRHGEFVFPVEVEFVFEDGSKQRQTWDGEALWKRFDIKHSSPIVSASVDPDYKLLLDIDMTNNSLVVEPDPGPLLAYGATWMVRLQALIDLISL